MSGVGSTDVLIVGAGPTGLTLAAQLRAFDTSFRIIDRQLDHVHESRALAVQPRTLEILAGLELATPIVERGNPAVRLQMHTGNRTTEIPLFDIGADDTAYPFLLFLSQADTEAILNDHLAKHDVAVERGVELAALDQAPDRVTCALRHPDGHTETVEARFVVGCDGANSTVREFAGIPFAGSTYPQTFILADLDAAGVDPSAAHVFLSRPGMLFLFPLRQPAPWRLLAMQPNSERSHDEAPGLGELQALIDAYASGRVRLRDPVWRTYFRLQHRHAASYRSGRIFVAGDAAHIHSPAGAQGMNTGIQDAWNLGWKLALVTHGTANQSLLDTYQSERQPVARYVLRFSDRAFTIATSTNPVIRVARIHLAPRLAQLAMRSTTIRSRGFRTLGQLAVGYRDSPAVEEGHPRPRRGPRPGDRLPDAPVTLDGAATTLHQAIVGPRFHLLAIGPPDTWPPEHLAVVDQYTPTVAIHRLVHHPTPGVLVDPDGHAHRRLGLHDTSGVAHYLIRPDGHIAYRAAGADLNGLQTYLGHWLTTITDPTDPSPSGTRRPSSPPAARPRSAPCDDRDA